MASPRSLPLLVLALAGAVLVVQARVIVGGQTWDDVPYHTQVAPPRLAAAAAVARGGLPEWWDGVSLGVPLAAEPGHGAAYPPLWLAQTPHALDLVMVLHILWAALGVAAWARRRSTEVGALVVGVLVATTGILASAALRGALPALAHLPWIGMLACSLREDGRPRAAIGIGVLVGAVGLAGQGGLLFDAVLLALVLGARRDTLRWLVPAVAAGLAIAAVQWLPATLSIGGMAGSDVHGLPFARLLELVVPGSFGSHDPGRGVAAIAGATAWAPSLYIGASLVALATVHRPSRRIAVVLIVFAVAALVVGRGGWPAWVGAPELHVAACALIAAAHAGTGLDAMVAGDRRAVFALGAAVLAATIALGAAAAFRTMHPDLATGLDRAVIDGALGLACLIAAAIVVWRAPGRWRPLVLALIVAPSVGATPSVSPAIRRSVLDPGPAWARATGPRSPASSGSLHLGSGPEMERAGERQRAGPEPRRMYRPLALYDLPADLDEAIATLAGSSGARWGIDSVRTDDPARLGIDDDVWLASSHAGGELLQRFAIGLAVLPAGAFDPQHMTELGRRGDWVFVRYPTLPVALVMSEWEWSEGPIAALRRLFPPGVTRGLARSRLVLSGRGDANQEGASDPVPCAIDRWTDGAIDLTCAADGDGYAVLSSSPAHGWSVTIDDHDAVWVTADVVRRAVALPSGAHRVHWRFTTPGRRVALLLGAVGALALLALWLAGGRKFASAA